MRGFSSALGSLLSAALVLAAAEIIPCQAATIAWTNTVGGNWNVATNWSPNQLPGGSDDVFITNNGIYTVKLNINANIGSLSLGGTNDGNQALSVSNATFTLNNRSIIHGKGILRLNGGTLGFNGLLTIHGKFDWNGGSIAALGSTLMIATNGLLALAGVNGVDYQLSATLTNAGTVRLVSGNLLNDQLINLAGALVDMQSDVSIHGSSGQILNWGTVRKSGGTGTTALGPPNFGNDGTLEVQTGTVSVKVSGGGGGLFQADAGATLSFPAGYTVFTGGVLTGAGTILLGGGTFTLNGSASVSNVVVAGASMDGTGLISGTWTWTSGRFSGGSAHTVTSNGMLVLAGQTNTDYGLYGVLTNAGTVRLASGNLGVLPFPGGRLINLPGGLLDVEADVAIHGLSGQIFNWGTVRKSGGTATTVIEPTLTNVGTLDVESGTVSLNGSYTLTGGFLNFGISGLTNFGRLNLSGNAALTGTASANFNNGYTPVAGNSFPVLTYGSHSGSFTSLNLPAGMTWQTNYTATTFTLTVLKVAPVAPALAPFAYTNGHFVIQINGTAGSTYILMASTNLTQWADVLTNAPPTMPYVFNDASAGGFNRRYYRVRLQP